MKNLIVVSHVAYNPQTGGTRNPSVDIILREYAKHFEKLVVVIPSSSEVDGDNRLGANIEVWTVDTLSDGVAGKIQIALRRSRIRRRMRSVFSSFSDTIVQLRIPSLFSMIGYRVARELDLPITTYIAGDWPSSFAANYQFPGSEVVGRVLDLNQRRIISNTIPVTAGPALAQTYSGIAQCHAYFSTTHQQVYRRLSRRPVRSLLFVGRLEPRKRLQDGIMALQILKEEGIYMNLVVVGDGVERSRMEGLVRKHDLNDRVEFKGYVRDMVLLDEAYEAADILVLPSVSEGTAKVLAEAMARGVVPVAADGVGSNNYVVRSGVNGLLHPPQSPDALASSLRSLYNDQELFESLLQGGYEYAEKHTLAEEVRSLWSFVRRNV